MRHGVQLLITFSDYEMLDSTIDMVYEYYSLDDSKLFILQNVNDENSFYLTYNISIGNYVDKPSRTMLAHRKKETNTIYTINAVNQLAVSEIGYASSTYEVNWSLFKNSLLLTDSSGLVVHKTKLYDIID